MANPLLDGNPILWCPPTKDSFHKMENLPLEIIENILLSPKLTIRDVINFSSVNSYYRNLVLSSNAIWKGKFITRWPQFRHLFTQDYPYYFNETRFIYELKRRTRALLETMPSRFYKKYELSDTDLEEWGMILKERPEIYDYLVTDLTEIVNIDVPIKSIEVVPLNTPGNKTLQYYANKVLRYIQQLHLTSIWKQFLNLPRKLQLLEVAAVFVAKWCQPNIEISHKVISDQLDSIADMVKRRLHLTNPDHPLFKVPPQELNRWKIQNLDKHQFPLPECRQILTEMREVMYNELGFTGNNIAYYIPENSLINKVLETRKGLPITLAILYESIGRRLGLRFEPISFPAHFLLRFTESDTVWYYIDTFNGGNIVHKTGCPHSRTSSHKKTLLPVATAPEVVERMANNLELSARQHAQPNGRVTRLKSVLELLKLVSPQDLSALVNLAKLYMLHNMDTRTLEQYLMTQTFDVPETAQRISQMLRDYSDHRAQNESEQRTQVEVAQRTSNLKFAVGMVMTHSSFNYKCVIYDWDPICLATPEWQAEMNVSKLHLRHEQPFYNVLVEDGSNRYVAQENLVPTSDLGYLHLNEDLGRHFSHFFETHYVPNAEKEKEYPDDKKVRYKYYYEMQLQNYKP